MCTGLHINVNDISKYGQAEVRKSKVVGQNEMRSLEQGCLCRHGVGVGGRRQRYRMTSASMVQ